DMVRLAREGGHAKIDWCQDIYQLMFFIGYVDLAGESVEVHWTKISSLQQRRGRSEVLQANAYDCTLARRGVNCRAGRDRNILGIARNSDAADFIGLDGIDAQVVMCRKPQLVARAPIGSRADFSRGQSVDRAAGWDGLLDGAGACAKCRDA